MKGLIIAGVVGLLFMCGGFWFGLRVAPLPVPKKAVGVSVAQAAKPAPDAISIDTLRKTSENLMDVNQALQAREHNVAERERRVQEQEEELAGERAALDRSHEKFKELYGEFQQRLQLLDANEMDQLQKQVTIYNSIDPAQAVDLIRAMDDASVTRLFSMMDVKPLSKIVSAWKAKYSTDSERLLTVLNAMGRVMPKEKMISPEDTPVADTADSGTAPADGSGVSATPPPTDSATAPTPPADASAPAPEAENTTASSNSAAPADTSAPPASQDGSSSGPAAADTAKPDPLAPPADSSAPAASTPDAAAPASTDSSAPGDPHSATATPPADSSQDGVATSKEN